MTNEQIQMLRRLIQDEIENSGIDGMEHCVWGWKEKALDVGWKEFQESFILKEWSEDAQKYYEGENK